MRDDRPRGPLFGTLGSDVPAWADPVQYQAMLAAIVTSSDDAIVSKDLTGRIMSWNAGAERVFGYAAAEAIGRSITMLLPEERRDEEPRILATLVHGQRVDHYETQRVTKDGRIIDVSLSVSPIVDAHGVIIGGAKIARDITASKTAQRAQEELLAKERAAREAAENANRSKDVFLAMVSHELRAPLSPIVSWARLLQSGQLDATKTARALEIIERSAKNQADLIDDLLDMARIVSGTLRLQVTQLNVVDVIERAIEVITPALEAKQIRLRRVLDTDPGIVLGDPMRLQQVVWNLLSNAAKFTPKNGRVQVTLQRVNSHVEIVVTDSGCGFAEDFRPYLFERFRQADTGTQRPHGGLGLGLAIVRHVVELHGGTVSAYSAGEGQGATFTVSLPRPVLAPPRDAAYQHPTITQAASPPAHRADPQGRLRDVAVLVVDDDPDSNEAVATLLRLEGADVRVAGSAAEAMDVLQRWTPTILVSDIGMPVTDGYAFLSQVRAMHGQKIFAIALTAFASTEARIRAFSTGFQGHLVKPVEPEELIALMEALVH